MTNYNPKPATKIPTTVQRRTDTTGEVWFGVLIGFLVAASSFGSGIVLGVAL